MTSIKIVILLAFIVVLLAIGPLLTIWALNTLFPVLAIEYNLSTWAAVILLGLFVRTPNYRNKD